jgi:hypothetical protein
MMISKVKLHLLYGSFYLICLEILAGDIWGSLFIVGLYFIGRYFLKNFLYSDREFKHRAPDYVLAALLELAEATRTTGPTIFKEADDNVTPFMNYIGVCTASGERKTSAFQVQAYNWDDRMYQFYNFKWRNFKVLWYKHCQRGTTMNRPMGEAECAQMLAECLKSLEEK